METYGISAGSKLSFGTMTGTSFPTSWTDLAGCTQIPDIGSAPETVETTTLDNLKFRTYIKGLQDTGGALAFPFNLEHPSTTANINTIAGLDEDTVYGWKITYASGVEIKFTAKPAYNFNAVGVNELESFTLNLIPETEFDITIPNTSF